MKVIDVEVAYARPDSQKIISLQVEEGSTIESIILQSGILGFFPEIDLSVQKVGVFGKIKKLTDKVEQGDRIEIYRDLLVDPKEKRRKRV